MLLRPRVVHLDDVVVGRSRRTLRPRHRLHLTDHVVHSLRVALQDFDGKDAGVFHVCQDVDAAKATRGVAAVARRVIVRPRAVDSAVARQAPTQRSNGWASQPHRLVAHTSRHFADLGGGSAQVAAGGTAEGPG